MYIYVTSYKLQLKHNFDELHKNTNSVFLNLPQPNILCSDYSKDLALFAYYSVPRISIYVWILNILEKTTTHTKVIY